MSFTLLMMDVAPVGGSIGVVAGIVFFLIFVAVAFIAFKILKKTAGVVLRVLVVLIILAVAIFGSVALFMFGSGGTPRPNTPARRAR